MINKKNHALGQATQSPEPTPPPAAAGNTNSKGGGSSQFCWARLGHGLIRRSISDINIRLSDTNIRRQLVGSPGVTDWKSTEVIQQEIQCERTSY